MNKRSRTARERLSELAKATTTPAILRSEAPKTSDVDSADYDLQSHRLWSARWAGATLLIVTLSEPSDSRTITAAPVTIEPGLEDKESVVLDASTNDLGLPITVWLGLTRKIPIRTLERPLGKVRADVHKRAGDISGPGSSTQLSPDARRGAESYGSMSPGAEKRAEMDDLLSQWIREMEPLPSQSERTEGLQRKPPFTLQQVMDSLKVPQRQAMNIVRGRHQLTSAEAQELAAHIGSTAEAIQAVAEPLPNDLLLELEQPRWRYLIHSEAQKEKTNEIEARLRIARQAFALAARQHGEGEGVWRQRLRTIALGRLTSLTSKEE